MRPAGNNAQRTVAQWADTWALDVYRYCRKMIGNDAEAEDLMQTVFVQAIEDFAQFRQENSPRFWLLSIARNRCLDRLRAMRRRPQEVEEEAAYEMPSDDKGLDEVLASSKEAAEVARCMDLLPAPSREVLVLKFHDQWSYEQIAKKTGDGVGALRIRAMRAIRQLRQCLEDKGVNW